MIIIKQKLLLTGFAFVLFAVPLLVAATVFTQVVSAQTIDCPRDPDYAAAGSFPVPTGNQGECKDSPEYIFSGTAENPAITYSIRNQEGSKTEIASLTLQDPEADPLIWEGRASYDNHIIRLAIPRTGLVSGASGSSAIRVDNPGPNQTTSGVRVGVNDLIREFAELQGIQIQSGAADLDADCKPPEGVALDKSNCGIIGYVVNFTRLLSALVGIVVVTMIAVGGIQYSSARDNPNLVVAAKTRIQNAVLALAVYLFSVAFLNYLIPGGLF